MIMEYEITGSCIIEAESEEEAIRYLAGVVKKRGRLDILKIENLGVKL